MFEGRKLAAMLDADKPVVVVATGGTIAQNGGRSATLGVENLIEASGAQGPTEAIQLLQVTSPNITIDDWVKLSCKVQEIADRTDIAGIVVTHGTDTLEETAFFLDLTCRSATPIVVVGAMRPASSPESDGEGNLRDGIALARSSEARGRGVLALLNGVVHAARDITKRNSLSLDAFESPNLGSLGSWPLPPNGSLSQLRPLPHFSVSKPLNEVPIIYSYAGISIETLRGVQSHSPTALVWAGTGAGSIPDRLVPLLAVAAERGALIVRTSRTGAGLVPRNGEVDDDAAGFIASSLPPQKARILLMLCVSSGLNPAETQSAFDACSLPGV